ncbi:hypothetical protein GpartN1_g6612.t1 [Galdieria partita]|uniref:Threonylcarbamoyl-AMP synthase n=1 Tax=Galdieria partita TaxID=83374 RepID=A0A9C7Q3N6_9RHOD|nr:hypothetical protein GpartN1_g6612.t1 [Galdieria partita]
MTRIWEGDKELDVYEAAQALKSGKLVAFPTETVYGLGANALDEQAVLRVFEAKGRPQDNPLIVHIAAYKDLDDLVQKPLPPFVQLLIEKFWPGPLSLVLKLKESSPIAQAVTGGQNTVAIRMPSHPIALALLSAAKVPVAAPSANTSGKPSPTHCLHVLSDLQGKIDGIVDGGETCGIGLESTVLDCSGERLSILRPGAVTAEQVEAVTKMPVVIFSSEGNNQKEEMKIPRAPGMKYRHYAPKAPIDLVNGGLEQLQLRISEWKRQGKRVGLLAVKELGQHTQADVFISCGQQNCLESYARELYRALRAFDDDPLTVDIIVVQAVEETGIGVAIMNRLRKAASTGFYMLTPSELPVNNDGETRSQPL